MDKKKDRQYLSVLTAGFVRLGGKAALSGPEMSKFGFGFGKDTNLGARALNGFFFCLDDGRISVCMRYFFYDKTLSTSFPQLHLCPQG
jgi:hypothetical protein